MKKAAIIIACIFGCGILYFANPENTEWLPKCWFYRLTGLQCPACGTQRALHQLLHGNFAAAFAFNPFLLVSSPYLLTLALVRRFRGGERLQRIRRLAHHPITVNVYLTLLIAWWVGRNIGH